MADKGWRRVVSRLARMDRREFLDRARQELSKRGDNILSRFGFDFASKLVFAAEKQPCRFFFASSSIESVLQLLRQRLPQQVEHIVCQADKICRHQFDLLGYENLDYGERINWHLDAVHAKQAPKKPFYKIRYLDFEEVGDCKVTWELNRHQHFVTLAKAYRLTEDRRYAEEIFQQWQRWHSENAYAVGINWASSLEVAFRSISWIWTYHLLEGTPALPPTFREEWLRAQAVNGRHIERYLSTYFSPNTHLLGEAIALVFLGTLCPEIPRAEHWKSLGWQVVMQETHRQVLADGFHFERSTYYHVYAIDFFLHVLLLASLNDFVIPSEYEKTLEKMLDALLLVGRSGAPPHLGDDDGGRVFDPRRNRSEHLFDPLATGAVLFGREDFKAAAGDLCEETIWLLGEQGVSEWDRLPTQQPRVASASLPSAGLCLLATQNPSSQLVVTARPQGEGAAHSHADALSVCLNSEGHGLLIDPGTFEYVGPERDLFRGTAIHNTLRVDGASQSETAGLFAWKRLARAQAEQWITGKTFDLFVGSHDGYTRLASPVIHRRWVCSLNCGLFLVRDLAEGQGKHRLDIAWHLGAEMQFHAERSFKLKGNSGGLALLVPEKHGWSQEVSKEAWSPVYGKKERINVVTFSTIASLPAEFVTLLLPLGLVSESPGKLTQTSDSSSAVKGYLYSTPEQDCSFVFADKGRRWNHARLASDAEFVCWRKKHDAEVESIIFCGGSYIEIDEKRILSLKRTVSRCEITIREGQKEVHTSDPEAL